MELMVIVASTRPTRVGLPVAEWFVGQAKAHAKFNVTLADLKEIALPFLDEPKHPRFGQYEHAHTKAWSAKVAAADAFVMVTPEYNYGSPPALINALDCLLKEWVEKPAAFVSYGGISGGVRSVQMTKLILLALKMVPINEAVTIPLIGNQMKDGVFQPSEQNEKAATTLLDALHRWATNLVTLRGAGGPGR